MFRKNVLRVLDDSSSVESGNLFCDAMAAALLSRACADEAVCVFTQDSKQTSGKIYRYFCNRGEFVDFHSFLFVFVRRKGKQKFEETTQIRK